MWHFVEVKDMKDKVIEFLLNLLMRLFGDKVLNLINKRIAINIWKNAFEDAVNNVNFFGKGLGLELALHRGIVRYYYATLHDLNTKVSVEGLAIAIAMEFYLFQKPLHPKYVYDFAEAILTNWHNSLTSNEYFRDKYSERISLIQYKKDVDKINDTLELLSSRDEVFKAYFNSYNCENSSTKIRVWLPRPNETWTDKNKESAIDISVNPMIGFELGFFRIDFDYSELGDKENGHLRVAYYSNSSFREGAEFSTIRIGETSGEIIWAI